MDFIDEDECYLCIDCARDFKLKKYILTQEYKHEVCHFCKDANDMCIQILDNNEFLNFLRALIRFHYWEDEYNGHFGGDGLNNLLSDENSYIFNSKRFRIEGYCLDNLTCGLTNYKFNDLSVVELYYGHENNIRCSFGKAIKYFDNPYIVNLKKELLEKNYFLLEDEFILELTKYKRYITRNLDISRIYFRARLGLECVKEKTWETFDEYDGNYTDKYYKYKFIPYKYDKISAPPVTKVEQGRLNRHNVSYLYLATDINTAISEVRPHPGHKVSIGSFKLNREIKIADLNHAFQFFSQNESSLKSFTFLNDIDKHLSMPIIPEERHMYLITQFFSDCFRKMGFDGVSFTSSVGTGENLLIFNPANFEYIEENASVFEIERLDYRYIKI